MSFDVIPLNGSTGHLWMLDLTSLRRKIGKKKKASAPKVAEKERKGRKERKKERKKERRRKKKIYQPDI